MTRIPTAYRRDDAGGPSGLVRVSRVDLSGGPERTDEGFLIFRDVKVARVGTQTYFRTEDGKPQVELRLPEDLFGDSMQTLDGKPVTLTHPSDPVTPSTFRFEVRGFVRDPRQDGDFLVADVLVQDEDAIQAIESGKATELSVGYIIDLEPIAGGVFQKPGHRLDGTPADFIQRNHMHNHLAIVSRGRANEGMPDRPVRLRLDNAGNQITDPTGVPQMETIQIRLSNGRTVTVLKTDADAILANDKGALEVIATEKKRADDAEAKVTEQTARADEAEKKLEAEGEKLKIAEKKAEDAEKKLTEDASPENRAAYQSLLDDAMRLTTVDLDETKKAEKLAEYVKLDAKGLRVVVADALEIEGAADKSDDLLVELIAYAKKHATSDKAQRTESGSLIAQTLMGTRRVTADDVSDSPFVKVYAARDEAAKAKA